MQGVPMGAACSPDIANLYAAFFEAKIFEHPHPRIPFYGRYIDDCLGIVYADSAEEALDIMSVVVIEDVQLEWSASEWNQPFLDMLLYVDPVSNQIHHTVYRKPLNHMERIPWASHHPQDVKKGTFLGEISRLATLSSKQTHYLDALRDLKQLYSARGYPEKLLRAWLKDNTGKRWLSRLDDPIKDTSNLFVLKSTFNPIWEEFNVKELIKQIQNVWSIGDADQHFCNLQGACSLHNWKTIKVPTDLQVRENRRLGTAKYKHVISGLDSISIDSVRQPRKRTYAPDAQQRTLGQFWPGVTQDPESVSEPKRRKTANPVDTANETAASSSRLPVAQQHEMIQISPGESSDDEELVPVVMTDSVSCLSTDDTLPRMEEPDEPYAWARYWEYNSLSGLSLVHGKVLDIRRTDLHTRRMLVSRKRTQNVFDLTAAWRKALINSALEVEPIDSEQLNEWSNNQ